MQRINILIAFVMIFFFLYYHYFQLTLTLPSSTKTKLENWKFQRFISRFQLSHVQESNCFLLLTEPDLYLCYLFSDISIEEIEKAGQIDNLSNYCENRENCLIHDKDVTLEHEGYYAEFEIIEPILAVESCQSDCSIIKVVYKNAVTVLKLRLLEYSSSQRQRQTFENILLLHYKLQDQLINKVIILEYLCLFGFFVQLVIFYCRYAKLNYITLEAAPSIVIFSCFCCSIILFIGTSELEYILKKETSLIEEMNEVTALNRQFILSLFCFVYALVIAIFNIKLRIAALIKNFRDEKRGTELTNLSLE